jgi:Mn2+/Fe2+ NRAMP family transporter
LAPAWLIVVLSVFSGVLAVPSADKGPGNVGSIIAVVLLVAALIGVSARNQWRALRLMPKPRWNVTEVTLICVAVFVGVVVGPHLLASPSNSALVSRGLGAAVAVIVAGCLFAANASYRRRISRTWRR